MKNSSARQSIAQFDKWADHYDQGIWNLYFNASNEKAATLLNIKNNASILDLGCGTGNLAIRLAKTKNIQNVVGLDISSEMIKVAKYKSQTEGISANRLKFVTGEVANMPFSSNMFDYVFCLNSFHHYENQNHALAEIRRVLKDGGSFILLDPFLDNPIRSIWGMILKVIFGEVYAKYHTRRSLDRLLSNNGFRVYRQSTFAYMTLFTLSEKRATN